jgi:hypothetical protein
LGLRDYPSPGDALPIIASININKEQANLNPRAIGGIVRGDGKPNNFNWHTQYLK